MKSILFCVVVACVFACSRADSQSQACVFDGNNWTCRSNSNPDGGPAAAFGSTNGQNSQVYAGPGYPQGNFVPNFGYPGVQGGFPGFQGGFPFQNGFPFGRR
ncbi:unnamed protein product [Larinioides sclopetarius]|uniref:Uncharacterized protein n=1 Tax=Larinioides sclopetarius TaxID=280406 RepID=A0AAV2B2P7_9ARAC